MEVMEYTHLGLKQSCNAQSLTGGAFLQSFNTLWSRCCQLGPLPAEVCPQVGQGKPGVFPGTMLLGGTGRLAKVL